MNFAFKSKLRGSTILNVQIQLILVYFLALHRIVSQTVTEYGLSNEQNMHRCNLSRNNGLV